MTAMTSLQMRTANSSSVPVYDSGRVLVVDVGLRHGLLELPAQPGALEGDVDDALLAHPEHDAALQHRGRVVEVHDRLLRAADGVEGALDEVVAALGEHLDRHVVGDVAAVDELAAEVEVGLAGAREADLDLLVAHPHEELEHAHLALGVHRVDEGLVAVTQVDGAPARGLGHHLVGPGAVGHVDLELLLERARTSGSACPEGCWGWIIWSASFTLSCGCSAGAAADSATRGGRFRPRRGSEGGGVQNARSEHATLPGIRPTPLPHAGHDAGCGPRAPHSRRSTATVTGRRTSNPTRR